MRRAVVVAGLLMMIATPAAASLPSTLATIAPCILARVLVEQALRHRRLTGRETDVISLNCILPVPIGGWLVDRYPWFFAAPPYAVERPARNNGSRVLP